MKIMFIALKRMVDFCLELPQYRDLAQKCTKDI